MELHPGVHGTVSSVTHANSVNTGLYRLTRSLAVLKALFLTQSLSTSHLGIRLTSAGGVTGPCGQPGFLYTWPGMQTLGLCGQILLQRGALITLTSRHIKVTVHHGGGSDLTFFSVNVFVCGKP